MFFSFSSSVLVRNLYGNMTLEIRDKKTPKEKISRRLHIGTFRQYLFMRHPRRLGFGQYQNVQPGAEEENEG
jgi:hypothetical protein